MAEMTLRELSEVGQLLQPETLADVFVNDQPRAMAALATIVQRRTDPDFTLDDAFALKMGELELIGPQQGEAPGVSTGITPQSLPVTGASIRSA
jgi:hypothetical protein